MGIYAPSLLGLLYLLPASGGGIHYLGLPFPQHSLRGRGGGEVQALGNRKGLGSLERGRVGEARRFRPDAKGTSVWVGFLCSAPPHGL